jgi:hypothetical protein
MSTLMTKADADATVAALTAKILIKDSKSSLTTGTTGTWSKTYPVGFWTGEPSVSFTPISASAGNGQLTLRATKTKDATTGAWTVSVAFWMLPLSVNVLLAGSVTLGVNPGTVTFDYQAAEPNAA